MGQDIKVACIPIEGMIIRTPPSAICEEAQRLLQATRADFSRIPTTEVPGRGTGYSSSPLGRHDFVQVRNQSELLRLVTIVEAFLDVCSAEQFEGRTAGRDAFIKQMAQEVRETSLRGWDERKEAFKKYHGISLGECKGWQDIDAAREVRNSIAHGLGHLTSRQGVKAKKKMAILGLSFRGDQLLINTATLEKCVNSAISFIRDVDRQLLYRP